VILAKDVDGPALGACQHAGGVVMAISDELVMMNEHARQSLNRADQAALLVRAADARGRRPPTTLVTELPSGLMSRIHYQPAFLDDLVGAVLRVQFSSHSAPPEVSILSRELLSPTMPGLVGGSASWLRCGRSINEWYEHHQWVALEGEPGVGKHALAHPTCRSARSAGRGRCCRPARRAE
jgi:hypothetical protein